jgi:hypothetical protein
VEPLAVILAFGAAFTVIAVPADVEAQPLALVIKTE